MAQIVDSRTFKSELEMIRKTPGTIAGSQLQFCASLQVGFPRWVVFAAQLQLIQLSLIL